MNLTEVPIANLANHPGNIRRNLGDLTELIESIAGIGVLQPLTVAPAADFFESHTYVVIAGHRRLAAARIAGLTTIPCLVRPDLTLEVDQLQAMLVENIQRSDLTVMEEAVAYEQLGLMGVTAAKIAKTTGRSRQTVESRLKLMDLPEKARGRVDSGQLSLKDAEWFAQFADDAELTALIDAGKSRWEIEWTIANRKRAADAAAAKAVAVAAGEPDEDDWQAKNAAKRAEDDAKRAARAVLIETSNRVRTTWICEQIESGSTEFAARLLRLAVEEAYDTFNAETPVLPLFGIEPVGEEEDLSDARMRIGKAVDALSHDKQALLLSLLVTDVLSDSTWSVGNRIVAARDFLGYEPADAELELLGESS